MKSFSKEEKAKIPLFMHQPKFQVIGKLDKDQRLTLNAIEDLFFIEFIESHEININLQMNILGRIIRLPKNLKKLKNIKYFSKGLPNLILDVNEADIEYVSTLIKKKISGKVLECQDYYINPNEKAFGPLKGINIKEKDPRNIVAFAPNADIEKLIACKNSWVFGKSGNNYISTVGLPEISENYVLLDEFCDFRFMSLLPIFFFLSECLGIQQFKPVRLRACCIVDDANLRMPRYGYMKYADIVDSAQLNNYHLAIGMVTIDYKKIGQKALNIFQKNNNYLSVLMHGKNHLREEMCVSRPKQERMVMLEQALWRMNNFINKTDLKLTRTMVFPHDRASKKTLSFIRKSGFQAVFKQYAFPDDPKSRYRTIHPLFEMFPSENTIEGLPIINRHSLEAHYSYHNWYHKILFHAWLGKPIIPWTHHYFFKNGLGELEKKIAYINKHISPKWTDIYGIVKGNYTIAHRNNHVYINLYSNTLNIDVPDNISEIIVTKYGRDLPINEEILVVNTCKHEWDYKSDKCLSAVIKTNNHRRLNLELIPRNAQLGGKKHSHKIYPYLRRYICELRDNTEPLLKWMNKYINKNVFEKNSFS